MGRESDVLGWDLGVCGVAELYDILRKQETLFHANALTVVCFKRRSSWKDQTNIAGFAC